MKPIESQKYDDDGVSLMDVADGVRRQQANENVADRKWLRRPRLKYKPLYIGTTLVFIGGLSAVLSLIFSGANLLYATGASFLTFIGTTFTKGNGESKYCNALMIISVFSSIGILAYQLSLFGLFDGLSVTLK